MSPVRRGAPSIPAAFAALWMVFALLAGRPALADRAALHGRTERFYSIHVASFSLLTNANRFVNRWKTKGNIVFWRETEVPGKGRFYRVYIGRFAEREDAVSVWEALKEEGAVSYFGVHAFAVQVPPEPLASVDLPPIQPLPSPAPPDIPPLHGIPPVERKSVPQPPPEETPRKGGTARFVDNRDGTVTDTATGMMWVRNGWRLDFVSALTWEEAARSCRTFSLGGHDDWRLPTLKEWMTLIDRTRRYPALRDPNPFVNMIVHMPYWTATHYAYDPESAPARHPSPESYTVLLYAGTVNHQRKTDRAFVLPVRRFRGE